MNSFIETIKKTLSAHANAAYGLQQQAYMKSALPFWGVSKPDLVKLTKPLLQQHKPADNDEYRTTIKDLFVHAQHREEWYVALLYARHHKQHITTDNIDLYIEIIRQAQW